MTDPKTLPDHTLKYVCRILAACLSDPDPRTVALAVRLQLQRHEAERARREVKRTATGGW